MNTDHLISPDVPVLSPGDSGTYALEVMEKNHLTELPVVADDNYIALVKETDLLDWAAPDAALSTSGFLNYKPAIASSSHPFDAIRIVHQMNLDILPVIDYEQKYIGAVTKQTLLKYISENSGIDNPGGIIVLEIAPRNYTLYEIARICENEDVIILNMQVHTTELGMLEVTLKLNRTALSAVVSSFERHSYHVKEVYGDENKGDDVIGKYNLLMNYINM